MTNTTNHHQRFAVDPTQAGRRSLQVSLQAGDYERLAKQAEARGTSLAGYIRGCLREIGALAPAHLGENTTGTGVEL